MTYHVYLYSESNPPGVLATFGENAMPLPGAAGQQEASKLLWDKLTELGREKDLGLFRIWPHDEEGKIIMQEKVDVAAWAAAEKDAQFALTDSDNSMLFNAMIAARHVYGVASKILHNRLLEAKHEDGTELSAQTFDVFAAVAGDQVSKQPAEGLAAVRSLEALGNLLPYLLDFFKADIAAEQQAQKETLEAKDKIRRSAKIRFGPRGDSVTKPLDRSRPLVVIGDRDAVLATIDDRVLLSLQQSYEPDELPHTQTGILRLKYKDAERPPIDDAPYGQIAPFNRWRSVGRNKKTFGQFVRDEVLPLVRNFPTDVIVIDDLGKFGNNLLTAGSANPSPVVLADAFKLVKDYAQITGVGLIVGLPWAGPLPENTVRFLSDCEVLRVQPAKSIIITE